MPAYPRSYAGDPKNDGMNVRTWLAGQALMGLCASSAEYKAEDMGKQAAALADVTLIALADKD